MKPGIIIENVAQTRRRLAETTLLATASLAPGSSSIVDEGPTNTGSGSQVIKLNINLSYNSLYTN